MELGFIVTIILIIALIFIILKIIKVFVKALILISVLLIIGLLIFSLLIHSDAMKLNTDLKGNNLILLSNSLPDYRSIITGFKSEPDKETGFETLNSDKLSDIKSRINSKEFDKLKKDENISRIFIVNESILKYDVKSTTFSFTREQGLKILHSGDAIAELAGIMAVQQGVDENAIENELRSKTTNAEVKSETFASMFGVAVKKNPLIFVMGYKSREIYVIPKTMLFKALDLVPLGTIERFVKSKIPLNQTE